jgi:hypothetical protein
MHTQNISVRQASRADLDLIVPLFDAYRQFYGQGNRSAAVANRGRFWARRRRRAADLVVFCSYNLML